MTDPAHHIGDVPYVDDIDPVVRAEFYDRVYYEHVQRKAAREALIRKHRREALQAIAIVVLLVVLLALAGGIERTGW